MSTAIQISSEELYSIEIGVPVHLSSVLRIMRDNFYHEETMFKSLCSSSAAPLSTAEKKGIEEYFDSTIKAAFDTSPCIIAINKKTLEVVGVCLTILSENPNTGSGTDGLSTIFASKDSMHPLTVKYLKYLSQFNDEANLFEKFPNSNVIWEFYAIAINKNNRKLGIAQDLMNAGIRLARSANVSLIFGVFTSIYSRKSAEKVGMKCITEFDLSKYREPDGSLVFKNTEPHNIVSVMVLEL